jgi:hypothetical protein
MILVETVPGARGVRIKENPLSWIEDGVNSNMICVIHCKNLCKCHNVCTPNTTIKGKIMSA